QVFGDQRTGGPEAAADIGERHALEIAGRVVVVDDGVEGSLIADVVPAGVRLAVHHHDRLGLVPVKLFDGDKFDIENLDHGPVFGPADRAVAGQAGRLGEARLHQVGEAEHAAEAVGVRVDVGHEGHAAGLLEAAQKPIRPAGGTGQEGVTIHDRFGAD